MKELEIYIDGASQGNPGPAGIGVIFTQNGRVIKNLSVYLGIQTNNFAEYKALLFALKEALLLDAGPLRIYTDSQLLCRQMNNEYKIRSSNLSGLYQEARGLLSTFDYVEIKYIPRGNNRGADRLAKKAIKERISNQTQVEVAAPPSKVSSSV